MLYVLKGVDDEFAKYLADDPVRPHIPHEVRITDNSDVFVLVDDSKISAVTCVSYQANIPQAESDLFESADHKAAIFYTIWSYAPGAGRTLLQNAVKHIQEHKNTVERFVTLSPKTEMARRFHLKNGAAVFRENPESVNYEYKV